MAIIDFADRETEKIFNREFSRRLPRDIQREIVKVNSQSESMTSIEFALL